MNVSNTKGENPNGEKETLNLSRFRIKEKFSYDIRAHARKDSDDANFDYMVVVDRMTGVNYVAIRQSGEYSSLSVLYDKNGKPIVSPVSVDVIADEQLEMHGETSTPKLDNN